MAEEKKKWVKLSDAGREMKGVTIVHRSRLALGAFGMSSTLEEFLPVPALYSMA
jgi:hypothetical protein